MYIKLEDVKYILEKMPLYPEYYEFPPLDIMERISSLPTINPVEVLEEMKINIIDTGGRSIQEIGTGAIKIGILQEAIEKLK